MPEDVQTMTRPVEQGFLRRSPLEGLAVPGRFGKTQGEPGVAFSVLHPRSIVSIIVREGQAAEATAALQMRYGMALPGRGRLAAGQEISLQWCGADQYYAVSDDRSEGRLCREMKACVGGYAACVDQSHGRLVIAAAGPRVRQLLAKGTSVDIHPRAFAPGQCVVTRMAQTAVHVALLAADSFELSVPRAYCESFWTWLTGQADEMGYVVR